MTRPAVLALLAALVLLFAIGVGAWLLAPAAIGPDDPTSAAGRSTVDGSRGSSEVEASGGSGDEASDATSSAAEAAAAAELIDAAVADGAAPGGGARGDGGAALGLPAVDTGAVEDLCEALEASQRRLGTSRVMMEKMPEKSRNTVGAKKLKIVHDRLEKEVERYERRAKARGECGV